MSGEDIRDPSEIAAAFACGPSSELCECRCPDGPCGHRFDGPDRETELSGGGMMVETTCSRCGVGAADHDRWVSP